MYAKLVGREVVPCSFEEWMHVMEPEHFKTRRLVYQTEVAGARVSTVFLGIDHGFCGDRPLWFETMIFGDMAQERFCRRYETYLEAQIGHLDAVIKIAEESRALLPCQPESPTVPT